MGRSNNKTWVVVFLFKTITEHHRNTLGCTNSTPIERGLFWVQSRYYDPEVGRFINADDVSYLDPETLNGLNLYSYCGNNPVMYSDPTGRDYIKAATKFAEDYNHSKKIINEIIKFLKRWGL